MVSDRRTRQLESLLVFAGPLQPHGFNFYLEIKNLRLKVKPLLTIRELLKVPSLGVSELLPQLDLCLQRLIESPLEAQFLHLAMYEGPDYRRWIVGELILSGEHGCC